MSAASRSTTSLRAGIAIEVDAMVERIEELEAENAKLRRDLRVSGERNSELLDQIHELREHRESA